MQKLTLKCHPEPIVTEILIGAEILPLLKAKAHRFALITDSQVEKLIATKLVESWKKEGIDVTLFSFPAGEEYKTRKTKEALEDQLLEHKFGRECCVIALGGGVVGDLAGFLAATYCRGVPLLSIPTTLLGMVDAGLGGKTGVNTPFGKNLIGAFHHPLALLIDPSFLSSLPEREWRNGSAEILKYGLISDRSLWEKMASSFSKWQKRDPEFLQEIILQSCKIKKEMVEKDPHEKGIRRLLNFGHTVGHAIETLEKYQISHGEAIAIGMLLEGRMSVGLGKLKKEELEEMHALFKLYGLPLQLPKGITASHIQEVMSHDKKAKEGVPRLIILNSIGQADVCHGDYCTVIPHTILQEALL